MKPAAKVLAILIGLGALQGGPLRGAPATGPLTVHPGNHRYFADPSGAPVYLTGSHVWDNLEDGCWSSVLGYPCVFDFAAYLAFLESYRHNFIRLWTPENASNLDIPGGTLIDPVPYARTGPGSALDGEPRFDLDQFNPVFFDRLRERVIAAGDRGIYVSIMLFDGWGVGVYGGIEAAWRGHPFHAANNINGIDGDPDGDGRGLEVHTLAISAVTSRQKAYIGKIIDSVGDLDNVLYEIANESMGPGVRDWQVELVNYIKGYEAGRPRQHPVGMTASWEGATPNDLWSGPADWVSPSISEGDYANDPPAATGAKVVLLDTDHIWGVGGDRAWVWKSFTRGHNPIFMDPIDFGEPDQIGPAPDWDGKEAGILSARAAMGQARSHALKMSLAAMTPKGALSTTGYCLANAGSEYLVYQPASGTFGLDVAAGSYAVEWLDPATGTATGAGTLASAGGSESFTPPFPGDAVLYLKAPTPPPRLVGHWKLDENAGAIAADSSGQGNHGWLVGGAWTAGRFGSAVDFDGLDDHIGVDPSASLNAVLNQVTVSAWVYRHADQPGDRLVVSRQQGLAQYDQYFLGFEDNVYLAGVQTTSGYAVLKTGMAPNLEWIHLAVTYDGAVLKLYVNGAEAANTPAAGNILLDAGRPLILGAGQNDATSAVQEAVDGLIDDVRLYNYALGPGDIALAAAALLRNDAVTAIAPVTPPLAGLLPLDSARDAYVPSFASGEIDPEAGIVSDATRPLVFYGIDGPCVTHLTRVATGELRVFFRAE